MIPSIPQPKSFRVLYGAYIALFFVYLVLPLAVVAVFAFNDSMFPTLPWGGFTLDWFFNDTEPRLGLFCRWRWAPPTRFCSNGASSRSRAFFIC